MAKKGQKSDRTSNSTGEARQQKKRAKREAKLMLAIEGAKSLLEKAEAKAAKVAARIQARSTHVRDLEAELATFRAAPSATAVTASDSGFDHQQGQPDGQELATDVEASPVNSSDEENHAGGAPTGGTESQAQRAAPAQEVKEVVVTSSVDAPTDATGEASSTVPTTSTAPAAKPRTSTPRRSPTTAKASASTPRSAPTRRAPTSRSTTSRKAAPKPSDNNNGA